jgi:hypothetical protein
LKLRRFVFRIWSTLVLGLGALHAEEPLPLASAMESRQIALEATGNGRDQLTLTLRNVSPAPIQVAIPAGLIATGRETPSRVISLRAATASLPAHGVADVALPIAALSSRNVTQSQPFVLTTENEPRLAALLQALADQPDAPRATTQLAIFCLLEDITFAQWRQFLGSAAESQPTPAEVTQAIDALGLLRLAQPQQTFALARDADLKLRALRNPWSRAKAMLVYGLDFGDGAVPPDLRQLLHTSPGDNCPICRQRALMQGSAEAP